MSKTGLKFGVALGIAFLALSLRAQAAESTTPPAVKAAVTSGTKAAVSYPKAGTGEWKLVWSDEFDKDGAPDPANWGYERGFVRNNELQWYQPENAVCKGGILTIEAKKENKPNPSYQAGGRGMRSRQNIEVTAASMTTRGKHEFTYGKFEMRGRIDVRPGSWPAFWVLGIPPAGRRMGWPNNGEIDIMEYYRGTVLANVCYGVNGRAVWSTVKKPYMDLGGDAWVKEFHVWTMEWDENKVDLLLDGKLMNHFDVANATLADGYNAFHTPEYIILNQAIGGQNGGDPSKTEFPVKFEVDYVRVYQRQ